MYVVKCDSSAVAATPLSSNTSRYPQCQQYPLDQLSEGLLSESRMHYSRESNVASALQQCTLTCAVLTYCVVVIHVVCTSLTIYISSC